ncbi:MAG: CorA family divalent cation transporter [Eubacteriales bacterium]|nr:CorA family divalent cation transporter [Eubacteriales bacterium]
MSLFFQIRETLTPCSKEDIINRRQGDPPYVVVMDLETWNSTKDQFDMVIDMDMDPADVLETKAIVNYDSLTGSFYVPRRSEMGGRPHRFAFALDEKGIIFIENGEYAAKMVRNLKVRKRWRMPSLERFLYDFLEILIERDLRILVEAEHELGMIEDEILESEGSLEKYPDRLNEIRTFLMDLRIHYEQMLDLGQELEENENGFFREENLRYFRLFNERVMRLMDQVKSLRDYTVQLRELFSTQLDIRMNRIMTVLTIITAIFMPLTLIAGWYGMNFTYMPELKWRYSYLVVFLVSLSILLGGIAWFRKRKWL